MKSIKAVEGITRVIDRKDIFSEVYDMYYTGDIISECPIFIKFLKEDGVDMGGIQRDMFSGFWKEAYAKFFEGSNLLIPMVNPHIDMTAYPIFGRIISHGYLVAGYLPIQITLPTLICMLLGSVSPAGKFLLDAFLEYISNQERHLIKEVILLGTAGKFPDHVQEKMLNILSRFGCRQIPAPASFVACIEDIAKYEFITKPAAAIFSVHSGIPKSHKDFWNKQSISSISRIYNDLTVTPEKILNLLVQPQFMSKNEERVYSYFTCMIGNMNVIEGRNFLRFVTGSSVCSTTGISVTFNSLSGLGRRPIAHTCDCIIQLSSTYLNYDEFYYEFSSIFEKVNEEYTFQIDAV